MVYVCTYCMHISVYIYMYIGVCAPPNMSHARAHAKQTHGNYYMSRCGVACSLAACVKISAPHARTFYNYIHIVHGVFILHSIRTKRQAKKSACAPSRMCHANTRAHKQYCHTKHTNVSHGELTYGYMLCMLCARA